MNQFQAWYRMQPRALRALLTINVVLYVLWIVLFRHIDATAVFVFNHLALNPGVPEILFEPWQLITYNFLHLEAGFWGFLHILFNMLWLVWIGREYEELHGPHRLTAIYLIGGIGGGLLSVILAGIAPDMFGGIIHGASASVLGVLMTVAILYPYKSIALIFLGTIRLIYVVIGFLVLDLLFIQGSSTAVAAHLGGALFGFLFAKAEGNGIDLSSWAQIFFRERRSRRPSASVRRDDDESFLSRLEGWLASRGEKSEKASSSRKATISPLRSYSSSVETETAAESEVDRILDKISEEGYDALTEEEKRILYEASKR